MRELLRKEDSGLLNAIHVKILAFIQFHHTSKKAKIIELNSITWPFAYITVLRP